MAVNRLIYIVLKSGAQCAAFFVFRVKICADIFQDALKVKKDLKKSVFYAAEVSAGILKSPMLL